MSEIHFRTCNLCEAMCGLKITFKQNTVLKIEGDEEDPLSQGHICPKAYGLKDIYEDPDRLKSPLKRVNGKFESISWEEAFEEVSQKILDSIVKNGPNSIGVYQGNPSIHNLGTMLTSQKFFKSLGTKNMFTATSTDQLPHHFAAWLQFGHPLLIPITDIDRTEFFIVLGANPMVSNGSMMSVPGFGKRIKNLQKRGGKMVVIDPRFTETAKVADTFLAIKPGKDVWLLGAMLHYILSQNLFHLDHLENQVENFEVLKNAVCIFTLEKASVETGISKKDMVALAETFAKSKHAAIYGRMGVSTQQFGGLCHWLINALNVICGQLDVPGGLLFTLPAIDFIASSKPKNRYNRWQSRVRKLPEFLGELPAACMAEEIETAGEGQIKTLLVSCGNPVLSTPNGNQLAKALEKLDLMVSFDIYLNETSKHAHFILPPATGLETMHYDLTFHNLAIRNTSKFSPALFPKDSNAKYDWEIFYELGVLLAQKAGFPAPPAFNPESTLDQMLQSGPYKLSLAKLKENPHGIDLGALKAQLPGRLKREKIDLAPDILVQDLARLQLETIPTKGTFTLIGKRNLRDNNSWMHNSLQLQKGKNRCVLLIHPEDANPLEIKNGDMVEIESRVGKITIPAELSTEIASGVLCMPHGYGHGVSGTKLQVANQNPGASLNDLTDHEVLDTLTGNAAFSNLAVRLKKVS